MKLILISLSLILIVACTSSEFFVHKETNTSIKVLNNISLQEAQKVINYVYKDYKHIEYSYLGSGLSVDENFKYLKTISLWNTPRERIRTKECKYSVNFYYPNPVNPDASSGKELCVGIINKQLRALGSSRWMGN